MYKDSDKLVKVIVEEGEVNGVMYVVSEVWEDSDGCVSVGKSYVNSEDMVEKMKEYEGVDIEEV